jgi:radical SAM superfamily enzyme YgiQ (UPF0313 family)
MAESKHKIVLYNPLSEMFTLPLALMAIGSGLDQSVYEVIIIDSRIESNAHQKVLDAIEGALCFGATILTGSCIKDALSITRKVKEHAPEVVTVWGGWHTSLFPIEPLKEELSIDITVQGQGELTFKKLVEAFKLKSSVSEINGISYRNQDGEIIKTASNTLVKPGDLPPINYELIDVEAYYSKKGSRRIDYISSVGCLYRCAFCADPKVFQRKFAALSPQRMGEEVEELYRKYAFDEVNFQDETFFTYRERAIAFAKELLNRNINISWTATMRADQGDRLSNDDFALLAKSGLKKVLVGVESGSQEMMNWLQKDITIEQVISTAKKCTKHNLNARLPIIVGFPGESKEAFESSLDFAIQLGLMSAKFEIRIFYFRPYPGSAITNEAVKQGYKLPETLAEWSEFDFMETISPWMTPERFKKAEMVKFYLQLAISKRRLIWPLAWLAKKRLETKYFGFPVEVWIKNSIKKNSKT